MNSKLEQHEARREAHHQHLRHRFGHDAKQEVAQHVGETSHQNEQQAEALASKMKNKAYDEIAESEKELERGRIAAWISQVMDVLFYTIYSLLLLRFSLFALGARSWSGFMKFLKTITYPFYEPFKHILPTPKINHHRFYLSILVAVVVFALVH